MTRMKRPATAVPSSNMSTCSAVTLSSAEITQLRRALITWFRNAQRDLPWRRTSDPYAIWLSEIMLQQTRVETVIPYYEKFLAAFPTIERLAKAPLERLLRLWAGLGYYSRARNLHAAAKSVVREYGGLFPSSSVALQTLPGVGRYTAAAIASIAFGEAVAVLDGNVKRVLARLLAVTESIDKPAVVDRLWRDAEQLLDSRNPGDFNQAMMELGATVCTPRNPRCESCPLRRYCAAAKRGIATTLPIRKTKVAVPLVRAVGAAIVENRDILLVQRKKTGLLAGFWTLPGTEIQENEDPRHALRRFAEKRFSASLIVGEMIGEVRHEFTHRSLRLEIYGAGFIDTAESTHPQTSKRNGVYWHKIDSPPRIPLATIDIKAIECVSNAQSNAR